MAKRLAPALPISGTSKPSALSLRMRGRCSIWPSQTAVTTSLARPVEDFEVNARGTLNVLEALRQAGSGAPVVFASTNKVYGGLDDLEMVELEDRYLPANPELRQKGIGEDRPLSFCTPYGCSKGSADQYVLDYAASF